jgi:ribosomal protein S14
VATTQRKDIQCPSSYAKYALCLHWGKLRCCAQQETLNGFQKSNVIDVALHGLTRHEIRDRANSGDFIGVET